MPETQTPIEAPTDGGTTSADAPAATPQKPLAKKPKRKPGRPKKTAPKPSGSMSSAPVIELHQLKVEGEFATREELQEVRTRLDALEANAKLAVAEDPLAGLNNLERAQALAKSKKAEG